MTSQGGTTTARHVVCANFSGCEGETMKAMRIITSVKEAAVCRYFGCRVDMKADPGNDKRVLFLIDQEAADNAIEIYMGNHRLPVKDLLDALSETHRDLKAFARQGRKETRTGDHHPTTPAPPGE